jgi:hypothetical protein
LEKEPANGQHWQLLGESHYRTKDWKAASAAMQKALQLFPSSTSWQWFYLSMSHWQLGDQHEARQYYDRAVTWMLKNKLNDEGLRRLRGEAATLLGGRLEGEAPAKAAAKAELGAFMVLGGKDVAVHKYDTLAEAVRNARDGDTIEVRGNGPFITPPIRLGQKALTIRAGAGFRPIIKLSPEGLETDDPLIWTSAPLVLEGLELQRIGQRPLKKYERQIGIFVGEQAPFRFANCRFIVTVPKGAIAWCLTSNAHTCVLRNCEFIGQDVGLFWGMPSGGRCSIDNCLHLGVNLVYGAISTSDLDKVSTHLGHNTVVRPAWASVGFGVDATPKVARAGSANKPLRVKASANIFDSHAVLAFHHNEKPKPLRGAAAGALIARLLDWREERHLYAPGASAVTWNFVAHGPKDLGEWNRFWRLTDSGSREGRARYQGGDLKSTLALAPETIMPEEFRLCPDSAGYRAGKDGKDLGADVDLVGPGRAYERWKKTPAYQQWLKDTGQKK